MFEAAIEVVKKEFESIPDNESLVESVVQKLRQTYDNPPVKDFEVVMNKPFTVDEVRTALFSPHDDQIFYYVNIILSGYQAPIGHPLKKSGSLMLTLIYLIHRKNYEFLKEFVISNGLLALSNLFCHENLYERSQAFETFMSITDCDVYDWFRSPDSHMDRMLHQRLLELCNKDSTFLDNLIFNRKESYPGGSFRALQILAFWLSWVRALYSKDHSIALSPRLVRELRTWSKQTPDSESGVVEEEIQLANTIFDDFCKNAEDDSTSTQTAQTAMSACSISGIDLPNTSPPPASLLAAEAGEETTATPVDSTSSLSSANEAEIESAVSSAVSATAANVSAIDRVKQLKESGNDLYRRGDVSGARERFEEALCIVEQSSWHCSMTNTGTEKENEDTNEWRDLDVTLRTNLSNALWKMYSLEMENIEKKINNAATNTNGKTNSSATAADCPEESMTLKASTEPVVEPVNNVADADSSVLLRALLDKIIEHCEKTLQLQPVHTKAFYRLMHAWMETNQHDVAYQRADLFKEELSKMFSSSEEINNNGNNGNIHSGGGIGQKIHDDIDRIARLQRRCVAKALIQHHDLCSSVSSKKTLNDSMSSEKTFNAVQWGMPPKRLKLLSRILGRDNLSDLVPASIVADAERLYQGTAASSSAAAGTSASSLGVSSLSASSLAARKAKEDIVKVDPKVDKILDYLFEQRDETIDRGVMSQISGASVVSATSATATGKKKTSSSSKAGDKNGKNDVTVVKVTPNDRKKVQQWKATAPVFATLMLRGKTSGEEYGTVVSEKEKLIDEAMSTLQTLLLKKNYRFKDLFLTLDENDILLLVSTITKSLESDANVSLGIKILEGLISADRLQSLLFLFRMEHPSVRDAGIGATEKVLSTLDSSGEDAQPMKSLIAYKTLLLG